MASYEFSGKIKQIGDLQTFASGFTKREVVVAENNDRWPNDVAFAFTKDRARQLESFAVGDEVKVSFDLRGREYNGRHFIDLNGWKIEKAENAASASPAQGMTPAAPAAPAPVAPAPAVPPPAAGAEIDNLPF